MVNEGMIVGSVNVSFIDENGTPYGIRHVSNKPRVSTSNYLYDIGEGIIPGHKSVNIFGHNDDVGAVLEDIWTPGGLYTYLSGAESLRISSTSVADTSTGVGARTMSISGLDGNYNEIAETITLSGTTPIYTTGSFLRVHFGNILTAGGSGANIGSILIQNNGGTINQARMNVGDNRTMMTQWTVPSGYTAYIISWQGATGITKDCEAYLCNRSSGGVFLITHHTHFTAGGYRYPFDIPIIIPEKSDIVVRASAVGGGGDISAGYELWYESGT